MYSQQESKAIAYETPTPSLRRKPESIARLDERNRNVINAFRPWIPAFAGVSVLDVKGFQMAGAYSAIQGVTAFSCSSSLRITPTKSPFLALPR